MSSGPEKAAARDGPWVEVVPPVDDSEHPERTDPEQIGRYELCFELAAGGMATVYLARMHGASGFEKLVALKRIHRHLAKEKQYVDMFLDEARIASRITHRNVCSVFDFGEADGEYYIAMEYLLGEPLSRLCGRVSQNQVQRRHALLPLRMASIIADACEGLHAAHELKDAHGDLLHVVHRDVSPRNLFVTYDGSVQVVDFGIASARQRMHHTATGQVKGTFAYMAPEQLTASLVDRRVDIWALGVALWEMLTLKRLFRRDTTANTVHAVLYDDIERPSARRPHVPEELDAIVMKALERSPRERWQTARDMGRALRQFLADQEDVVGPPELSEWMAEVFPQGEARKSQLMEVARLANDRVPAIPRAGEADVTITATDLSLGEPPTLAERRRPPRIVWAGAAAAVALVLAVAVGMGLSDPGDDVDLREPMTATKGTTPPMRAGPPLPPETTATEPSSEDEKVAKPDKPRRGRAKAAPKGTGTINLVTRGGWAEVYKRKKRLGSTPSRLKLPAGRHKLTLKPFGDGAPKSVIVTVEANKTKNVSVRLQ